ncbi:MAG: Ig-like domain-containing protein [Acutalibacteraceae bacterium]|nr:Ig-like domain-containing protein [Acutalibacteraceae bacterium]
MSSKKLLKKVTTVVCAGTLLVTAFIPTVSATDTDAIETEDNPTQSVDTVAYPTEDTETATPVELFADTATEPSTELSTEESTFAFSKSEKETVVISGTSLSPSKMTMGVGESYGLKHDFGTSVKCTWTSSDSSVVSVTSTGAVTAKKIGSATVTCKSNNGQQAVCTITVKSAPTSLSLDETYIVLGVGETYDFSSTVNSGAGSYLRRYCSSSSVGLPIKASGGLATAKKEGRYTVACYTYNGVLAKCTVVVKKAPTSFYLGKTSVTIEPNKSYTLTPVLSSGSYSNEYDVSSSNTSVATAKVSSDNKIVVTAKSVGTTTIKAKTYNGKTASCNVTVKKEDVQLSISATSTSILKGNHAYIKATVTPSTQSVTYSSSNTAVAKVSSNGIVTGVGGGSATITVTAGSVKKTCKITVSSSSSNTYVPYTTYTLNNGKTLYLKSSGSSFSSSDTSVATVNSNGFVTAKKQGVAIITANYNGSKRTCAITVIGSDPIRFSYSSPNSASKNRKVTLIAITDKQRTSVKFDIKIGNTTKTVSASSKTLDSSGNRYIWKGYYTFSSAGEYPVTAYSMYNNNGKYSTCSAGKSTVFVTDVSSATTVSFSERRPSNELLALNADYEGFLSCVTDDPLVYDTPTVGYGYVVTNGDVFYNNMSQEEAFAFMVSTMNDSVYSSSVNEFMSDYNIKFNQQQFDALVMLVYNLGPGVLYDDSVSSILTNCWHNGVRDMNYVNKTALKEELIQWHHAGGCVWGLLYRRIDELEVFCYGDYIRDGSANKYGMTYRWNCY